MPKNKSEKLNITPQYKISFFGRLRGYFFAGTLVIAPVFFTFFLAWWLIDFFDNNINPLIPKQYNPELLLREYLDVSFTLPGFGLLITVVFITLVGAFTAGYIGRLALKMSERLLNRMPFIRSIYSGSKQIIETIMKDQKQAFSNAVLVEYPRKGIWAMAFLTNDNCGESINQSLGDHTEQPVAIFLPTTPNPTSGFLLFVPKKDIVILDIPIESAVKMIISAGIVTADDAKLAKAKFEEENA